MPDFVLEIGTEEVPASAVVPALAQLRELLTQLLDRERIRHGEVRTLGTPRRLTAMVSDVSERQEDAEVELAGPPASAAFDAEGKPTRAAEGFARKNGLELSDLEVRPTARGDYVFAKRREVGIASTEALAAALPEQFTALNFPKFMRWGEGRYRFSRPIRWILCLLGEQVVPLSIESLEQSGNGAGFTGKAGRITYGHRTLSSGPVEVASADRYEEVVRSAGVILDPAEREKVIVEQGDRLAAADGSRVVWDPGLLREVTFVVEYPTAFLGRFDDEYLRLPRPVLVSAMKKHQRYFTLENDRGELAPRFLAVRNGGDQGLDIVREGNERVLAFRFNDAVFYFDEDRKTRLEEKRERLKRIVFLEKLGSLYDKSGRLLESATALCDELGVPEQRKVVERAALLCKADLASQMVMELPELQGTIGREYALLEEEPPEVAAAIGEHYRPRAVGDPLPETMPGKLLSLADRLDTLVSTFSMGLIPTGSFDPFGLRRQAAGAVALLQAMPETISAPALVDRALDALHRQGKQEWSQHLRPREEVRQEVIAFIQTRLQAALDEEEIRSDLAAAVLEAGWDRIPQALSRARFLQEQSVKDPEEFERVVMVATRVRNIVRPVNDHEGDLSRLEHETERALADRLQSESAGFDAAASAADWPGVWRRFEAVGPAIDQFFVDVLVMAEDPALKAARIHLLSRLDGWFCRVADFSKVATK